eukprot:TRINITY_DN28343_c3_g1_i1.p1 TRINITY_DN28343_c3_g1~~TRINITY_DN28343_c3_g1_i1.p1  ORF type:complete len:165 (+),score=25.47 TRINITY_DN28343_c3_g1_i1:105-599(+)
MEEQNEDGDKGKFKMPFEFGINRVGLGLGVGCGFGVGVGKPFNFSGVPIAGQIIDSLQQGANMLRFGNLRGLIQKTGGDAGIGCGVGLGYGWGAAGIFVSNDATEFIQINIQKVQNFIQKNRFKDGTMTDDSTSPSQQQQQQHQQWDERTRAQKVYLGYVQQWQ